MEIVVASITAVGVIIVGLISAIVSYRLAIRKSKEDAQTLIDEHSLSALKDTQLMMFRDEKEIYRELSKHMNKAVARVKWLFPENDASLRQVSDMDELYSIYADRYSKAMDAFNPAQECLWSNMPFISEDISDSADGLLKECSLQINDFYILRLEKEWNEVNDLDEKERECLTRTDQIRKMNEDWIFTLRQYLKSKVTQATQAE